MWKPLFRCSLIGGLILFLWMIVSWMINPLHWTLIKKFKEEPKVTAAILDAAPQDGIYVIPSVHHSTQEMPKKGPFIFINVKREVTWTMTRPIVISLLTQIISVGLVTYLLLQAKAMKYWNRVLFFTIAGIVVTLWGCVPQWNWWHFPCGWTVFIMFDSIFSWFLCGLVIGKLVKS